MGKIGDKLRKDGMTNDGLLEMFRAAQQQLLRIVEKADPTTPFGIYRSRQLREIDAVLVKLKDRVQGWTEDEIPTLVDGGADEIKDEIDKLGEQQYTLRFAGVPLRAIKVLTEDAFLDFGRTMVGLRQDATRAILNRRKLQEQIVQGVIQGSSVARTQNQLMNVLREQGFTVLKARNGFGRRFSMEHYTNMLVRTQSMTAYNIGTKLGMLGAGRRFGIFPTIPPGNREPNDPCWAWEKKKYVDLLKDPLPPQSTHPNCRHRILPVSFAQLKAERPDLYRLAIEYYRKTANAA